MPNTRQRADAIDPRIVFWCYAALAGMSGVLLLGWGPMWLGAHLAELPCGRASLIRVLGAISIAAACMAIGMASIDDPPSRRRGLLWLTVAHAVVAVVVTTQREAVWGPGLADWVTGAAWSLFFALFYLCATAAGERNGTAGFLSLTSIFGRPAPGTGDELRSAYERQIRAAAAQEERNRLARDLHDSIKQQIFVVQTAAATAQARFQNDPPGAAAAIAQVRTSARDAMAEMEAMLDQLRAAPLENAGLTAALAKQCEALGLRTGADVEFKVGTLPPNEALAPGAQQAIFRVAQEAHANVGRHARASNVRVTLDAVAGWFELTVRDDGTGFEPGRASAGMGIANMRNRAAEFDGTFELMSHPGEGATVRFSVPYERTSPDAAQHRRSAYVWAGLLLIFFAANFFFRRSPQTIAVWFIALIGFARHVAAYMRLRRREGTAG
ncbi:MAG TPA: sensor histidine kinase [Bryobacteraceae bacterium]|nr:sensor histidine kinase [Bryobacteraceae bacterium]